MPFGVVSGVDLGITYLMEVEIVEGKGSIG